MQSLHNTRPDRRWRRFVLVCLAGHALSCSPSDFDELPEETERNPSECAESKCLDAGSAELEAGQEDDPDADPTPGEPDPATEDADAEEPADDADIDDEDASPDASTQTPDTGDPLQPPVCDADAPACQANEVDRQMEACGNCGSGVRSRTRTCAADGCSWGAWSAWSACADQNTACDPNGPAQTQTVACTTCGTKTQSRSCSRDTCTWGPWTDISACTWCQECSQVVYCDTPANIADRGTWCRQKACSREQALGDCMDDVKAVCGATVQPFLMEYL